MSLFSRHSLLQQTAYSDLKRRALEQDEVLVGTPGSVGERAVKERRFHYRQFYDAVGRKAATYIGPVGQPEAEASAERVRERVRTAHGFVREARELARVGYVRADARSLAVLAAASNHALFRGGATLVGSHAYGVLLNDLGVKAGAYATEDVDLARGHRLRLGGVASVPFASVLAASTVPMSPVPGLGRNDPATSYKALGTSRFRVDLLMPTASRDVTIAAVPELAAHATALPHLAGLLESPVDAVVLGREGVVPVRVPRPEVFAWHKALVSQLRGATIDKRTKDLTQAAVLFAVLAEEAPDAVLSAFEALPRGAKGKTREAGKLVVARLETAGHERARDLLREILNRRGRLTAPDGD